MIVDFFSVLAGKKILSRVVKKLNMPNFLIYPHEYYYSNIIIPMVITKNLANMVLYQKLPAS